METVNVGAVRARCALDFEFIHTHTSTSRLKHKHSRVERKCLGKSVKCLLLFKRQITELTKQVMLKMEINMERKEVSDT